MDNLHQHPSDAQASRTRQAYESKPDRTIARPSRDECQDSQANFTGTIALTMMGRRRFLVNIWAAGDQYRLRLSEKDGSLNSPVVCQLYPVGTGRFTGALRLFDETTTRRFTLRVWLHETDERWLKVHFETIPQR